MKRFALFIVSLLVCTSAFAWGFNCVTSHDESPWGGYNRTYCFPPEPIQRMVNQCGGNYTDYYITSEAPIGYWETIVNTTDPCNSTWSEPYASGYAEE